VLELQSINFVWPRLLWALCLLPVFGLVYARMIRRPRAGQFSLAHLQVGAAPAPRGFAAVYRHGPALIILLGLGFLMVAIARPRAIVLLPARMDTVMLAIDSSGSMRAADILPSRIEAAQTAARAFVEALPSRVKLGVVSLAGSAAVVQGPTDSRDDLFKAIDGLTLQRGSALGSGIVVALATLLPAAGLDVPKLIYGEDTSGPANTGAALPSPGQTPPVQPQAQMKAEPGSNASAVIVLLSDGQSNFGPDVVKMAGIAANLGVRVYTVGLGTPEGVVLKAQGMSMRVRLDEDTLKKVAEVTHAEYFRASTDKDLIKIYKNLGTRIALQKHQQAELTAAVALLGIVLVMLAALLSFSRQGRVV
jgi:Ca-activated chloride channel family protein